MKPLHQTYFYGGDDPNITKGNCWQTVIASYLELPLDEVPHFVDIDERGGENWWTSTYNWLAERGYRLSWFTEYPDTDDYVLVTGKSPRGDWYHVVLYKGGVLAHDPHPDGTGILTEEHFDVIEKG